MFIKVSGLLTFQCETCHDKFSASQQIRNVWFLIHTTAQVVSHQLLTAHQFFQSGLFMPKFSSKRKEACLYHMWLHLKQKKVWRSHKIRHFPALNVTRHSKTEVFCKHFSILQHWCVLKTPQFFMHGHTWCKKASNLHEDTAWITQPFF